MQEKSRVIDQNNIQYTGLYFNFISNSLSNPSVSISFRLLDEEGMLYDKGFVKRDLPENGLCCNERPQQIPTLLQHTDKTGDVTYHPFFDGKCQRCSCYDECFKALKTKRLNRDNYMKLDLI